MRFTRRIFVGGALALTASFGLSACGYRGETIRYRLTVEVDTPQGLRSGSSVLQVRTRESGKNSLLTPEARGVRTNLKGEAVAVEMPDGRLLFALLRRPPGSGYGIAGLFGHVSPLPKFEGEYASVRRAEYLRKHGGAGVVPRDYYPLLVTFADLKDPASIQLVDPDNLVASFGEGVALNGIKVEITDDPVTFGITDRLTWLPRVYTMGVRFEDFPEGIPLGDFIGLFSTEVSSEP